jgi:hypothetical protein
MIKLKYDSRDKIYQNKFGQAINFPDEINFDTQLFDDIQPIGDVKCVAYTTCDIAEDQKNLVFDIDDLWKRVGSNEFGSDPREVLGEAVKNGLLVKGESVRRKEWKSYWRADLGNKDSFDNVRSSIMISQSPIGAATYWYSNWFGFGVLPKGEGITNAHMYSIEGWKQVDGKPHLIIEAWLGRKFLMSREIFNESMKPFGMQSWVLSTSQIDARREKTLTETVKDILINLIIKLKELLVLKQKEQMLPPPAVEPPKPEPVAPKRDLINEFCLAIRDFEGKPGDLNYKNNNPGNLRSLNGSFMKFKTYEAGWLALRDYVIRACTGGHKSYRPDFTILQFFKVYAPSVDKNDPVAYANWVANKLNVPVTMKIKDLLS